VARLLIAGLVAAYIVWSWIVAGRLMPVFLKFSGNEAIAAGMKLSKLYLLGGSILVLLSFFVKDRTVFLIVGCFVWFFAMYCWLTSKRLKKIKQ